MVAGKTWQLREKPKGDEDPTKGKTIRTKLERELSQEERDRLLEGISEKHGIVIQGTLGEGGLGTVYRVKRKGKLYALKAAKTVRVSLQREAKTMRYARFHGAYTPTVHEYGDFQGLQYILMDLIEGRNFDEMGVIPPRHAAIAGIHLAISLGACHQAKVIHYDVKPENAVQSDEKIYLLDYGLAEYFFSKDKPFLAGTPTYMPPEKYHATARDPRSDLFSLGATLYTMVTGKEVIPEEEGEDPFDHLKRYFHELALGEYPTLTQAAEEENKAGAEVLEPIVHKLLEYNPRHRYQSAGDVREALDSALARL